MRNYIFPAFPDEPTKPTHNPYRIDPKEILNNKFRGSMVLSVNEKNFSREVLGASVPVLVNFWAPWCSLCRVVQPMLLHYQTDWGEQVKLVSINADENFKLANTYRLTTLPTVLVFEGGQVHCRLDRFRNRDDVHLASEAIRSVLENLTVRYGCSA